MRPTSTPQHVLEEWDAEVRELQREARQQRKEALARAGGKHTKADTEELILLQQNRCVYCDAEFTVINRPSKDHLLPVTYGGGNSALNLVLACRGCNCRRGNAPLLSYRMLLSEGQNRGINKFLLRRLKSIESRLGTIAESDHQDFVVGLRLHDPENGRLRSLLEKSPTARRNRSRNKRLLSMAWTLPARR